MIKHPLYDAAVNEVRGQASDEEIDLLKRNVFEWRSALQSVVDEVDAQLIVRIEQYNADVERYRKEGSEIELEEAENALQVWEARARTFKKHVSARLLAVRRMCQEVTEQGALIDRSIDIEAVLEIVDLAIALADADLSPDEEEFDRCFDDLFAAVEAYRND